MALPLPASATASAVADIRSSSCNVDGVVTAFSAEAFAMELPNGLPGNFSWRLKAERLALNWTNITYLQLARPTNPSEWGATVQEKAPQYGHANFESSVATSFGRSRDTIVRANGSALRPFSMQMFTDNATIEPFDLADWRSTAGIGFGTPAALGQTLADLGRLTQAHTLQGRILFTGDFSIYLWEAPVQVLDHRGTHSFDSGNISRNITPTVSGYGAPARELVKQTLRLDAKNASLEIEPRLHQLIMAVANLTAYGAIRASFADADGVVHGGDSSRIKQDRFLIQGNFSFTSRNESGRLASTIRGPPSAFGLGIAQNPDSHGTSTATVSSPSAIGTFLVIGLLLTSLLFVGLAIGRHTLRVPSTMEVQEALFGGRVRRATRLASRMVKANPTHPDAVLLYGASLAAGNQHERLAAKLPAMAVRLRPSERSAIALLIAVASTRLGDEPNALRWASEAAQDPHVGRRMRGDPMWFGVRRAVQKTENPGQTGYA